MRKFMIFQTPFLSHPGVGRGPGHALRPANSLAYLLTRLLAYSLLTASPLSAQPYYAAKKGLSCSACHINPAGAGMRKPRENAPGFISDSLALGADFRFLFAKTEGKPDSSFGLPRAAFYALAQPLQSLYLMLSNNQGVTAEAYAMTRHPQYPVYARAGRFFVPYGLQLNDADNSSYSRIAPFAPSVGFSMAPTQSDTGLEFGFNPKDSYFINLAMTNGQAAGGSDNSNPKAVTGRWGIIGPAGAMGATVFANRNSPAAMGQTQRRYGLFGWTQWGPLTLLGEGGWGQNRANASGLTTNLQALYVELNYGLLSDQLLLRGKFEHLDPDTTTASDERRRYILGSEWFAMKFLSLETQLRMITESPRSNNNEGLILTHVWF